MKRYEVRWTETARTLWREIQDRRLRARLLDLSARLEISPETQGRPLREELSGYWSLHWSRWRLVYSLDDSSRRVWVCQVGLRAEGKPKDVYRVARKLLGLGLLAPLAEEAEDPR